MSTNGTAGSWTQLEWKYFLKFLDTSSYLAKFKEIKPIFRTNEIPDFEYCVHIGVHNIKFRY